MSRVTGRLTRRVTALLIASALGLVSLPTAADAATVTADDGARVTSQRWIGDDEFDLTIDSPAVGGSVKVRVLVPKGWSATATRTWPVVYAYHGGRDTYVSWTRSTDIEQVAAKYGVMVVMPDGGWVGSYANWYNYGQGGPPAWETFHTSELLQLMRRGYHAGTDRAAIGLSSGGEGAVTYAARHPGMFDYAASYSGILHTTQLGMPGIMMGTAWFGGDGEDPLRIYGIPWLNLANWRAHDPYVLASHLRGTGLYVSSGTTGLPGPLDDGSIDPIGGIGEAVVGTTNVSFVAHLKDLGIPVTAHLYGDGLHNWAYWQREMHTSWPLIMKAIGATKAAG